MTGAKLGDTALKQIAAVVEQHAKRLINREINRFTPPAGMQARYIGKTTEAVTQGTPTTIALWSRGAAEGETSAKGEEADTGQEIEDCYPRMGDIDDDMWVFVEWIDGGWEVYCVECP
jgi:hypothetical protein